LKIFLKENEAVVLFDKTLRHYLTGFSSTFGIVVISANGNFFITDKRYFEAAEKTIKNYTLIDYDKDALLNLLKKQNIKKIFTVLELLTADKYIEFTKNGFLVEDNSLNVYESIAIKDKEALKNIKTACRIAEKSYSLVLKAIKEDITEKQLAEKLESLMQQFGAEDKSFDTIVAFGKNTAVPHHETGNAKLKENQPVLIDFGCKYKGYCSDMTRSFYFGKPHINYMNSYFAVLNAHINSSEYISAGRTAGTADKLARDILTINGYGEKFTHSLGHGVGLDIHEYPYLRKDSKTVFKEGMVFTIEPGVYFKGKFGIRIENTYAIINGKAKSFMNYTKDLEIISNGKIERIKTYQKKLITKII